jgi:uncharacterized protein YwqG
MRVSSGPDWLPGEGRLLFFYEFEHGSWGLDPEDAGSAVVLYETDAAPTADAPNDLPSDMRFEAYPVAFVRGLSTCAERLEAHHGPFSDAEGRAVDMVVEEMAPAEPSHQVGGYAGPIQNDDMEWQCEAVSRKLASGEARRGHQKQDAADWRLLLQIDTDDEAGMMWGDMGRLYFWVREQHARAGDFSRSWTILQCH